MPNEQQLRVDMERYFILHGIKIIDEKGELKFWIPLKCHHLQQDGTCRIYDRRPQFCKNFKCDLLKNEK